MKQILHFLEREKLWPVLILVLGALVILPGLGQSGFWEPVEIGIADRAKTRMENDSAEGQENENKAPRNRARPKQPTVDDVKPPLTEWSVGHGMEYMDSPSLGARLPLALLGLVGLLATFFLGRRLASPRAGLFAGLILLSFPLFLFQSRQLMSDIGAVTGSALVVLGLTGLAWPVGRRPLRARDGEDREERPSTGQPEHRPWLYATDLALVAVGSIISYFASAALLGVVVPFGAVAVACLFALAGKLHVERDTACAVEVGNGNHRRWYVWTGLALMTLAMLAAVALQYVDGRGARAVLSYGFLPALVGVVLAVMGLWPRARCHRLSGDACWRRWHLFAVGLATLAIALGALFLVLAQVFDLRDPIPGERALFGYSLAADGKPLAILGGAWREHVAGEATFDVHFEQIAFGLFPWVVLAPVAIAHIAMGLRPGRFTWSGYVLFAWAALAWIICGIIERKVGPVLYPALVPVAVAVAVWIDDLMDARDQADATIESEHDARIRFGMSLRPPLVAFFVFMAALTLAVNISFFPDRFLSVNVVGASLDYPKGELTQVLKIQLSAWLAIFGVLFGVALSFGLALWASHKRLCGASPTVFAIRRHGIRAALGVGVLFALFLTHVWTPTLSGQLSSKNIFATYNKLRAEGDELGLLGQYGSAPDMYVDGEYRKLRSQGDLVVFMGKDSRVFAMVPSANQCALHRSLTQSGTYYVLERNAKHLLISNQLKPEQGVKDINPLTEAIIDQRPESVGSPVQVNYDDRIELIGVDMPDSVARGETFTMTLYYKVLKPISGSWKVFVHFDGGGTRFQGDHDPIDGLCATNFWQPGDYIVDRFTVGAGDITFRKTEYTAYVGFFQGSHGNWKNMKVVSAESPDGNLAVDNNNRVRVGRIRVH